MMSLMDRIRSREPIIADGAMGTYLADLGETVEPCPEAVNVNHPEALEQVARAYLDAGAEILQTNTFGGSPLRLGDAGLAHRVEEVNRGAASAARRVARDRAYVTGSVGPSGRMLAPYGDLDPRELRDSLEVQIIELSAGGVDAVSIETMIDVSEAVFAVEAAREVAPELVVFATGTFRTTPAGLFTPFGTSPSEFAERCMDAGADVVGANCGVGVEDCISVLREMRKAVRAPLIARPNAGLPVTLNGRVFWPETPEAFAEMMKPLFDLGAVVLGGCCGTTPDHIRGLKALCPE